VNWRFFTASLNPCDEYPLTDPSIIGSIPNVDTPYIDLPEDPDVDDTTATATATSTVPSTTSPGTRRRDIDNATSPISARQVDPSIWAQSNVWNSNAYPAPLHLTALSEPWAKPLLSGSCKLWFKLRHSD
jgi:hypothetical protein